MAMTPQDLQDKYGYVVMGWDGPKKLAIGDVLPRFDTREPSGERRAIESPICVVGFSDVEEWKSQLREAGRYHLYRWDLADTFQVVKVRAE